MIKSVLLAIFLAAVFLINAQEQKSKDPKLEKLIDEIFPVQDEDFNYEELYENYAQLLANPLNLNLATEEQLRSLSILTTTQLFDFLQYRKDNGPLLSFYELQVISSFNDRVINLLEPFVSISDADNAGLKGLLKRVVTEKNNYFVTRFERTIESKAGYKNSSPQSIQYSGSPYKVYNRFRINANGDFSFGFTTEKDAGEKFTWNPSQHQLGFDYVSAHGQIQNKGIVKNLIVGDYQAQFGQGLTLGGGFGMGKGSETITTMRRSNLGFTPYTSAAETGFFRGVSSSVSMGRLISLHLFYSRNNRDGNSVLNDSTETISSLYFSGFHRTKNEIDSRKNLTETNWGAVLQVKTERLDAGIIAHQTVFSTALHRNPTLYNQFAFDGSSNTNMGYYANYTLRNFSLFSEVSQSLHGGSAVVAGLLASVSQALDISLLYRSYSKNYYSFYSNSISESSTPQNEKGIYWGWKYKLSKSHFASGYIDLFQFPWLRFISYSPSNGSEWMLRYNYTPSKAVLIFVQMRQEEKNRNLNSDAPNYLTGNGIKTNYWINADYKVSPSLGFKTRIQLSTYQLEKKSSNGIALIQDVNYDWRKFSFSARFALFHTDSYDTRLYTYEKDAWLAFSIPALQGVGTRRYILIQYRLSPKIDLWLRWAATVYENQDSVGSAGEQVTGSARNDFKFQFRIKL